MIATALAANAAGPEAEAAGTGVLARIRDHLRQKGVDEVVDVIVELAELDAALFPKPCGSAERRSKLLLCK
jgi:hypothetical protein